MRLLQRDLNRRPLNRSRLFQILKISFHQALSVPLSRIDVRDCPTLFSKLSCAWKQWRDASRTPIPWEAVVRETLTQLGPAFIKIGQILSVRSDLIPTSLAEELRHLQEEVPPLPFEVIRPYLEAEFGTKLEETFHSFDETPLAAGSLAQVYQAELLDRTLVAVKIKRPGIDEAIEQDLSILVWLAFHVERFFPMLRGYQPLASAEELYRYTLQELDFQNEASVTEELRVAIVEQGGVRIPKVLQSSSNLIVMEHLSTFPADNLVLMEELKLDRKNLVRRALDVILFQILEVGLFHADPHPGNLRVSYDGDLVFLDFGIYGRINVDTRRKFIMLMSSLFEGNLDLATFYLTKLAAFQSHSDLSGFRKAIRECYENWVGATVVEYGFCQLLFDQMALGGQYGLLFPSDIILLAKSLVTVEGVALSVDPELNISEDAKPYLQQLWSKQFPSEDMDTLLLQALPLWWDVAQRLPIEGGMLADALLSQSQGLSARNQASGLQAKLFPIILVLAGVTMLALQSPPLWLSGSVPGLMALAIGILWGLRS